MSAPANVDHGAALDVLAMALARLLKAAWDRKQADKRAKVVG